ncbi:MAG: type 4a pilus biogenesis protein PilO [Bacillota bacterium]
MENRLSKRVKILLSILTVLGFSAAVYYFVLGPQIDAYQEQAARLAEARMEYARLNTQIGALPSEIAALEEARARFEKLSARFSTATGDGLYLAQIGSLAEQNKVQILKFNPAPPADLGFGRVLPVEVELRGLYPSVLEVIDRLEKAPHFTEIRSLKLAAARPRNNGGRGERPGAGSTGGAGTASFVYAPASPDEAAAPGEVTAGMILLFYFK